jgi:hypothetical protein
MTRESKPIRGAPVPAAPIRMPLPGWVPLWKAPFFFLSDCRMQTAETWAGAFSQEVGKFMSSSAIHVEASQWSVVPCKTGEIVIHAGGVSSIMSRGWVGIWRTEGIPGWGLSNTDEDFLRGSNWDRNVPSCDKPGVLFHKRLLIALFKSLNHNFLRAIESGAAHLMARPESVLAPFERLAWDQWRWFKLEKDFEPFPICEEWRSLPTTALPTTAIGPDGERLYSIYVGPGDAPSDSKERSPENECQRWLLELLHDHPDRSPYPLSKLCNTAISKFPGLTKRGFQRALVFAQSASGNRRWSLPGAPKKTPAISAQ